MAAVEKYPDDVPKDLDSFDKVLKFLIAVRDGALTPDLFYLGQVPNEKGRFCARFDSILTVEIPTGEIERSEFVQTHQATSCRQGGLPEAMRTALAKIGRPA